MRGTCFSYLLKEHLTGDNLDSQEQIRYYHAHTHTHTHTLCLSFFLVFFSIIPQCHPKSLLPFIFFNQNNFSPLPCVPQAPSISLSLVHHKTVCRKLQNCGFRVVRTLLYYIIISSSRSSSSSCSSSCSNNIQNIHNRNNNKSNNNINGNNSNRMLILERCVETATIDINHISFKNHF